MILLKKTHKNGIKESWTKFSISSPGYTRLKKNEKSFNVMVAIVLWVFTRAKSLWYTLTPDPGIMGRVNTRCCCLALWAKITQKMVGQTTCCIKATFILKQWILIALV